VKHKNSILIAMFVALLLAQVGCSSYFKRQDCEATNWFEYGQKVALSGRRLSGDQFVAECHKVEAEIREVDLDRGFKAGMARYCDASQVFNLGKSGEFFSPEMCDGENLRLLEARHKAGVAEHCKKTNGYSVGATGKAYNGICPKEFEPAFLPEFNRGRKKYIAVVILQNDGRINQIDRDIIALESERNSKAIELSRLQAVTSVVLERNVDHATGVVREQLVQKQTDQQKRAADDARWKVQNLDSQINSKRQEQATLRERNRELQLEAIGLDDKGEG
jgi:hypothetical protein